eukprot:1154016-Pelagomonas_calceolata.AAC.2
MDRSAFNECIKTLSNNKSPGPDGVANEILRMLSPEIQESIHKLSSLCGPPASPHLPRYAKPLTSGTTRRPLSGSLQKYQFYLQVQYHTRFAPMITEKWALPLLMKAGLTSLTTSVAARTGIECAYCQMCNYPDGYEPINSEPPYLDKEKKRKVYASQVQLRALRKGSLTSKLARGSLRSLTDLA